MRALVADRALFITAALVFVASAVVTVMGCASMSSMPGMEMPGGWTMSMTWMRMPGQGWPGAAAMFAGMWAVMMIAMMLPALVPMLLEYRRAIYPARGRGALTWRVAAGYFGAWTAAGLLVFPAGVALAELAMRVPTVARATPLVAAILTMLAGAFQLSVWKSRQLACCRETVDCCRPPAATAAAAWRHGVDLGIRCLRCCAPLSVVLIVMGVMDLRAMAVVTAAIGIERLAPRGERVARVIGMLMIVAGLLGALRAVE